MSIRRRLGALTAALVLVEIASFWKLSRWLFWTEEEWLAYASALAFVGLLLASIVAMGSDIPDSMRKQFYIGGVWLFVVQGLANVLIAYQFSLSVLPVEVVTRFFGVGAEVALKSMSILQGATLSVVSIAFWSVLGQMLRTQGEEQRDQREKLRSLDEFLEGLNDKEHSSQPTS